MIVTEPLNAREAALVVDLRSQLFLEKATIAQREATIAEQAATVATEQLAAHVLVWIEVRVKMLDYCTLIQVA